MCCRAACVNLLCGPFRTLSELFRESHIQIRKRLEPSQKFNDAVHQLLNALAFCGGVVSEQDALTHRTVLSVSKTSPT